LPECLAKRWTMSFNCRMMGMWSKKVSSISPPNQSRVCSGLLKTPGMRWLLESYALLAFTPTGKTWQIAL
jgi:hypothetical protein